MDLTPNGCQIIGQSTKNQPVRSRKHIHSLFDLKIAIFSTALVRKQIDVLVPNI